MSNAIETETDQLNNDDNNELTKLKMSDKYYSLVIYIRNSRIYPKKIIFPRQIVGIVLILLKYQYITFEYSYLYLKIFIVIF
jgi:hypothetical protein